jgi:hypothetical protein
MVFASDKEGTQGGMDLFLVRKNGDKWSAPENLGNSINTSGNEFFPFLDSDNNLFFSSDGLPGYGGYDVFTCRFNGTGWDKPINLTNIINTLNDDVAFTINRMDGRTAFYTTRVRSERTGMQLFKVTVKAMNAIKNKPTISYLYHGNPLPELKFISALPISPSKPAIEDTLKKKNELQTLASKKEIETSPVLTKPAPAVKEKIKVPETTLPKAAPPVKAPENVSKIKTDTVNNEIAKKEVSKDEVIYRVQISSHDKSQGIKLINVNGKGYYTFEYYYRNAFRTTIGEFSTLRPAVELQNALRQSGTTQAFVVVFKNNIRSADPSYFK